MGYCASEQKKTVKRKEQVLIPAKRWSRDSFTQLQTLPAGNHPHAVPKTESGGLVIAATLKNTYYKRIHANDKKYYTNWAPNGITKTETN